METFEKDAIAIIAMEGKFPGANDVDVFWNNIKNGIESISHFSDKQLREAGVTENLIKDPKYVKARGVVYDIELFDAQFFGYSPREATITDPQHRLFLEACWSALEKAGYCVDKDSSLISVFAGMAPSSYLHNNLAKNKDLDIYQTMIGTDASFLTTKVSYNLNLTGPSFNINTACSTSLVAVATACKQLLNYECDMALAGGITIVVPQIEGYIHQDGGILSPDGHCRAFDAKANGTVQGEGLGVVVLKRLGDAIAARDNIDAVIIGAAINNDGADKVGYTAPSVMGQARCIAEAIASAEITPDTISYIETHGTGTNLGDPIEIEALSKVFRSQTDEKQFCAIGSVKTNIGHTDCAAGVAGLIKAACALKNKVLPPSLNFEQPNSNIDFANSPFYVNTKLQPWKSKSGPRRAGVSSFGIGGTNAHLVLEEAPILENSGESRSLQMLMLSAKTETALNKATDNLREFLQKEHKTKAIEANRFADIAYTLQIGRKDFDYRRSIICKDADEAIIASAHTYTNKISARKCMVFMFQGQGGQYLNMGLDLYKSEPVFKEHIDICCNVLLAKYAIDFHEILFAANAKKGEQYLQQTRFVQPMLFMLEYALAQLFMSWGIQPQAVVGHSSGEYAAAVIAGVFKLEDALILVAERGKLFEKLKPGSMLVVPLPEDEILSFLQDEDISIAAVNAPTLCVVSGEQQVIEEFRKKVESFYFGQKVFTKYLKNSYAFHSHMTEPILNKFAALVKKTPTYPAQLPFISTVTGKQVAAEELQDPEYWVKHMRNTVCFSRAITTLLQQKYDMFLEFGPKATLTTLVNLHNKQTNVMTLATLSKEKQLTYNAVAQLWLHGFDINWRKFYAAEKRHRVPLPTYSFERQRYWVDPNDNHKSPRLASDVIVEQLAENWFYKPVWSSRSFLANSEEKTLQLDKQNNIWLLFVNDLPINKSLIKQLEKLKQKVICVSRGQKFVDSENNSYRIDPFNKNHYELLLSSLQGKDVLPNYVINLWLLNSNDYEEIKKYGYDSLVYFAQALIKLETTELVEYIVIADKLQAMSNREDIIPAKALVFGPCITVPQEYSGIRCRCFDIKSAGSKNKQNDVVAQMLHELLNCSFNSIVAFRDAHKFVKTYRKIETKNCLDKNQILKNHGVYLIFGGLGNIGLEMAVYLAKKKKSKIVLVGRSKFLKQSEWDKWLERKGEDKLSRKILLLKKIKEAESELLIMQADASNYKQMQQIFSVTENKFGKINGIIYAAGAVGDGVHTFIQDVNENVTQKQFTSKVNGILILEKLVRNRNIDFCVLCSSISSIVGGLGFTAYAAANAFIDNFVIQYSKQYSTVWQSINWDGWDFSSQNSTNYNLNAKEGIKAFCILLDLIDNPQVIVSKADLFDRIEKSLSSISNFSNTTNTAEITKQAEENFGKKFSSKADSISKITSIFATCLGMDKVGLNDDFFELGGHSLLALQLISNITKAFGVNISLSTIYKSKTVNMLAKIVTDSKLPTKQADFIVNLQPKGDKTPMFLIHPIGGTVFVYISLIKYLNKDRPIYGIEDPGINRDSFKFFTLEEMASFYIDKIRTIKSHGPYLLGGSSFGGTLAFEMAQQLRQQGEVVEAVLMLDSWAGFSDTLRRDKNLFKKTLINQQEFLKSQFNKVNLLPQKLFLDLQWSRMQLLFQYKMPKLDSNIALFKAKELLPEYRDVDDKFNHWKKYCSNIDLHVVPGDHGTILQETNVKVLAQKINECLLKLE